MAICKAHAVSGTNCYKTVNIVRHVVTNKKIVRTRNDFKCFSKELCDVEGMNIIILKY